MRRSFAPSSIRSITNDKENISNSKALSVNEVELFIESISLSPVEENEKVKVDNDGTFEYDVFISYNHAHKKIVRNFAEKLKNKYNLKVWIDYTDINNGALSKEIIQGIQN